MTFFQLWSSDIVSLKEPELWGTRVSLHIISSIIGKDIIVFGGPAGLSYLQHDGINAELQYRKFMDGAKCDTEKLRECVFLELLPNKEHYQLLCPRPSNKRRTRHSLPEKPIFNG